MKSMWHQEALLHLLLMSLKALHFSVDAAAADSPCVAGVAEGHTAALPPDSKGEQGLLDFRRYSLAEWEPAVEKHLLACSSQGLPVQVHDDPLEIRWRE